MFNANFRAMKRTILLLFNCMAIGLMAANKMIASEMPASEVVTNEMPAAANKIDLTPKLKKGDQWKMVLKFKSFSRTMSNGKISPKREALSTAEWLVNCEESSKNAISFKVTLLRLIIDDETSRGILYNDTDFPSTLIKEQINEINQIIGKSITFQCTLKDSISIEMTNNDFQDIELDIPKSHIMKKVKTFLISTNYSYDRSSQVGAPVLSMLLKTWFNISHHQSVTINDKIIFGEEHTLEIADITSDTVNSHIKLQGKNEDQHAQFSINKKTKLPSEGYFQIASNRLDFTVYGVASSPNTIISGTVNQVNDDDDITLHTEYPIGGPQREIKLKNGKFEIALDLKESIYSHLYYNGKRTRLFLRPGMHLSLDFISDDDVPKVTGIGKDDLECFGKYKYIYLNFSFNWCGNPKDEFISKENKFKTSVNKLLTEYNNKISLHCKTFIEADSKYKVANFYCQGRSMSESYVAFNMGSNKSQEKEQQAIKNKSFFMSKIDSLILAKHICFSSPYYHEFLMGYLKLKQQAFMKDRGKYREDDHLRENLLFSELCYTGYPYYYSSFKLINEHFIAGYTIDRTEEVKAFSTLPCVSTFSNQLKVLSDEMIKIKVGTKFPYQEINDWQGKKHIIPKDEFCIVDFGNSGSSSRYRHTRDELERIMKENDNLTTLNYFVIIPNEYKKFLKEIPQSDLVKIKFIYLKDNDESYFKKLDLLDGKRRIYLLDPNHTILRNNIFTIMQGTGHDLEQTFEEYFDSLNQPTSQADNSRLWLIIVGSFLGFGLLSWLTIRIRSKQIARKEAARRKLTEMELKAIRSQMNPHFIFNAMGSIQNLINHNQIKNANLYLSRFARLMRMVLANSNKQLVTLADELELIQHYLELEQLRVDFQFSISCSDDIDPETEEIPGMLIQPLVENAVVHGLTPKGSGNVDVKFHKEHTNIICEIIDDGVGIGASNNGNGNGMAFKLSQKRLDLLNSHSQANLQLKATNRIEAEQTTGTRVTINIPTE
ncbi:hypothetical protein EYV94_05380 [Puteibacter caeruleilacunae]|nr:hypothetical protein EYV94_05380 [Puteibacter caeruleilacunae]